MTIGYDTPWRQVHAMLLLAAERTAGIRQDPKPRVLQLSLEDAAVRYALSFCLEEQESKVVTLTELHANIQDLFNEYGVQIMTPRSKGIPSSQSWCRSSNGLPRRPVLIRHQAQRLRAEKPDKSSRVLPSHGCKETVHCSTAARAQIRGTRVALRPAAAWSAGES